MPILNDTITVREVVELTEQVKAMLALVQKHNEAIYGNGKPGILRDLDSLKAQLRIVIWLAIAFFVPIISAVIAFVGGLLLNKIEVTIH